MLSTAAELGSAIQPADSREGGSEQASSIGYMLSTAAELGSAIQPADSREGGSEQASSDGTSDQRKAVPEQSPSCCNSPSIHNFLEGRQHSTSPFSNSWSN